MSKPSSSRDRASSIAGVLWGSAAVVAWTAYNVGSRLGALNGVTPADMTMLRFGVAALVLLPFVLLRRSDTLSWRRVALLTLLAGPLFSILFSTGFQFAPLSHAVVLASGATMLSATALAWKFDSTRPSLVSSAGMIVLIAGLIFIASGQSASSPNVGKSWIGDLCFLAAGMLWGTFTYTTSRWKVNPMIAIAQVSLTSAILFLPVFILFFHNNTASLGVWVGQAIFQGLLGGCLGSIAFVNAASKLGPADSALFPAMVPSGAILIAIPILGEWPSVREVAGIAVCTLGLLIALDVARLRGGRS